MSRSRGGCAHVCNEAVVRHAGKHCRWVRGASVDDAVSALLLEAMAPAAIDVSHAVQQEITQRVEHAAARHATAKRPL
ncbi:hypothetical protein RFN25_27985 [Mesorhizobium abyssinicae]|uniref:hypothetical protein n=1 Tax=Mesorhizobium abyssinicae TaxID=1209958 RepID=UPI002A24E972|nr:hypothetical protein [Mesorhizobium abyssinicae]MDX8437260.1 hypothetical protein [Mesorhizobium abyssinicae]